MANSGNKVLKELVDAGKESGMLSLDEINRSLTANSMSAEDIDGLMGTLEDMGIQVVDDKKIKSASLATKRCTPTSGPPPTPTFPTLSACTCPKWARCPCLTRDEEITLARNIREREKNCANWCWNPPSPCAKSATGKNWWTRKK